MSTDPYAGPPPEPNYAASPGHAAPYGPDPSEAPSKKLAAGLCGILLGGLGIHKFILGYNTPAIIMLAVTLSCSVTGACLIFPLLGSVAMSVIGLVEGILYLTKSDEEFYRTYMVGKKEWF